LETQVESLLEERKLWDIFMDHTPDYVFLKDTQSRFIRTSKSHAQMMGLDSPEEAIGKTDFDLFPQEDAQRFYDEEQEIMAAKQPVIAREWAVPSSSGETVWVSEHKIPVTDETGQVIGLLGITSDITERMRDREAQERLQQELVEAQKRVIEELSSPVIPIMNAPDGSGGIIVMPLIGSIDTMRARDITRSLLAGISQHRAKVVILDVTGVSVMDTGIVNHLNKTIQAARLKGARTIVTGISDAVAEAIVDLGIDWSEITTLSDLQTGLLVALHNLGFKLSGI
jgi:rsbT co-antagonist protein RsbR